VAKRTSSRTSASGCLLVLRIQVIAVSPLEWILTRQVAANGLDVLMRDRPRSDPRRWRPSSLRSCAQVIRRSWATTTQPRRMTKLIALG
jgi:hypothetical protein